ncbi:hypothetical protein E4U61_002356 [Claviceps capensis]|nr:hypothetical protein E4U61_002356 [Claviceps capensis]
MTALERFSHGLARCSAQKSIDARTSRPRDRSKREGAQETEHPLLQKRHMTVTPYRAMAERCKADHLIRCRS